MKASDLVELAAHIAMQSPETRKHARFSESGLRRYWQLACERRNAWERSLARFAPAACLLDSATSHAAMFISAHQWREAKQIMEEIFISEILTRVWTAAACDYDRRTKRECFTPIVRNVYLGHAHVRRDALALMAGAVGIPTEEAAEVNRLRRRCERWNDMLLGYLGVESGAEEFSFEPERTREFAAEANTEIKQAGAELVKHLVLASLRATFVDCRESIEGDVERNARFAAALVSCLPGAAGHHAKLEATLWLDRMEHTSSDALDLVERLVLSDDDWSNIP